MSSEEPKKVPEPTSSQTPVLKKGASGRDYHKHVAAFVMEFTKESDRACVILTGAKVDYLCGQIITKFLIPNAGAQDELVESDRALGTFNARIHALYRFGLIDAEFARALHLFRKLRNAFAHEVSGSKFDDGAHRDRIAEFAQPLREFSNFEELAGKLSAGKSRTAGQFYAAIR